MPIQFQIVPSAKLVSTKPKGRPKGATIAQRIDKVKKLSPQNKVTKKRTTVNLSAYGNRLFEPIMSREKPVIVEFAEFFSTDGCRFSKDGFFAIKYIALERRCYLFYFINPVRVNKEITAILACQEAIEWKSWEFEDEDDYKVAIDCRDYEKLVKIREKSCLGKVELKVLEVLKENRVAERFLKRQKKIELEEKEWKDYFDDLHKIEDKEMEDVDLENQIPQSEEISNEQKLESTGDSSNNISGQQLSQIESKQEVEETKPISFEARKENAGKGNEIGEKRDRGKKIFKINWGSK